MSSSRRFSRSVCLSRVATSYAPRTYTVPLSPYPFFLPLNGDIRCLTTDCLHNYVQVACRSFATAKKKDDLVFVVPSDWDLEYLSKFEVKATPEQLAKVIPVCPSFHPFCGIFLLVIDIDITIISVGSSR
jgi:hypothetical protein